jgi:hypothetical protein
MLEWKDYFEPHILARGRDYYRQGAVRNFVRKEDSIEAVVEGTEYYKVKIGFSGSMVSGAFCSCPYAEGGYWCKHMAAVLYKAEAQEGKADPGVLFEDADTVSDGNMIPVEELIKNADRGQLEELLIELASMDEESEHRIRAMLSGEGLPEDIGDLKREADSIFHSHFGRGSYIDYYNRDDFCDELMGFLEDTAGALMSESQFMEAFELSTYVFVKLGNTDIDDDGQIQMISDLCYGIWQDIISACSDSQRKQIRRWFEEHANDGTVVDYMKDDLKDFLEYELASRQELLAKIEGLDKIIKESGSSSECGSVFSSHYGYRIEAIELRIILMKKIGSTEEEIDDFRRKHIHFRSVREYFMKKAREEGNTQEEIRLLNQSREQDADSPALVHLYTKRLIEIYQGLGDLDNEKAERRGALMTHPMTTLDDFKVYKSLCGREEWEKVREDIIRARQDKGKKAEFLAEENMLEELYQLICEQKDIIKYLDKYGFLLADLYPDQILEQYETYVCAMAERARTRAWYDELLRYLRRMQQYRGGKEVVERLCRNWILAYPTRKVMVSELGKVLRGLGQM